MSTFRKSLLDPIAGRLGYSRKQKQATPAPKVGFYPEGVYPREREPTERRSFLPAWYYLTEYGQPRGLNVDELRDLAKTPTPWMCIRRLLDDVMSTPWEILPLAREGQDKPTAKAEAHAKIIRNWFMGLNDNRESWNLISGQVAADILELDSGVFLKEYASGGNHQMTQLWARDGARFLKEVDEHGILGVPHDQQANGKVLKNYRVGYYMHSYSASTPIAYEPHEIVYLLQRPDTRAGRHGLYGTAPMEIVQLLVRTILEGEEWFEEYFRKGAVGSTLISVAKELPDDQYEIWKKRLKTALEAELLKTIPSDMDAKTAPLGKNPLEVGWFETKSEYRQLVMATFSVTPEVLGFLPERATARSVESQRDLYVMRGLKPLLDLIEYKVNIEIISEFFSSEDTRTPFFTHGHAGKWSSEDMDVMFRYKLYDPIGDKNQLGIDEQALKNGLTTVNEIRARNGQPNLPWGDINPLFLLNPMQYSQSLIYGLAPESFKELTQLPDLPEPVQQALTQEATPPQMQPGKAWLGYKKSRLPSATTAHKLYPQISAGLVKLRKDLYQLFSREFIKAETPIKPVAWQHVLQAIDLLEAKLKSGRLVEEVLEEWFKEDLVKKFIFDEIGTELGYRIQAMLREYFGQKNPEEYQQ